MPKQDEWAGVVKHRPRQAILHRVVFGWKSLGLGALILMSCASLGLLALMGLISWLWMLAALAGGGLAWVGVMAISLIIEHNTARPMDARYSPRRLRSPRLQSKINRALQYRDRLYRSAQDTREGMLRARLDRAIEPVDDWVEAGGSLISFSPSDAKWYTDVGLDSTWDKMMERWPEVTTDMGKMIRP